MDAQAMPALSGWPLRSKSPTGTAAATQWRHFSGLRYSSRPIGCI